MANDQPGPAERAAATGVQGERTKLRDLATIIRSKNAGPFRVTFDILFNDAAAYDAACRSGAITPETIARLYGVPVAQISSLFEFPKAHAIKITMIRQIAQCAVGETDVYGAQQHAPLLDIEVPTGVTGAAAWR